MDQFNTLGKYHILERLAAGRLADVYKAKTTGLAGFEKIQILIRILPRYTQDLQFARSFIEEMKIAFSLNHRNIMQVFEFGRIEHDLYIAMEFLPGVNLDEIIRECRNLQSPMPIGLTCYLVGEVAAGLDYAHRKIDHFGQPLGIVHTDIKPLNIACSFEGSVKILDFGLSCATSQSIPLEERLAGPPRYMSPELVLAEDPIPISDVFSLGVILWELLTGTPLFVGKSVEETLRNVLEAPIVAPANLNPEVPSNLNELTVLCLERDKNLRLKNAEDLHLQLHQIQKELGEVIGSSTLADFLSHLFPYHSEIRDVRQDEWSHSTPPNRTGTQPHRPRDLLDAATELAEPLNPPPPALLARETTKNHPIEHATSTPATLQDNKSQSVLEMIDTSPHILGEKKRVIVVTALLELPEEQMGEATQLVANIAYKLGGTIHRNAQGQMVILFGLPNADENDVVSAIRFVYAAKDSLESLLTSEENNKHSMKKVFRFGIRAGTAKMSNSISTGGYRIIGTSVPDSIALAHLAPAGMTYVAGTSARLAAKHYILRQVDPSRLPSKFVRCHVVLGPRVNSRHPGAEGTSPLFGRTNETREILSIWRNVLRQNRQKTIVVSGEPGVGKSRLVDEFVANQCVEANVVFVGTTPHRQETPYGVIADIVRNLIAIWPTRAPRSQT
ncbi:MAG: serine/threonine-protein kinase, partial [Pseudomonadota bacterium]